MCVNNHCSCKHSSISVDQDRTPCWVSRNCSKCTLPDVFIANNLYALRISGIPFQRKSFTIINQTVLTFLNGGLVNLLSYTPLWCNSPTDLQQMWETAMKAGILTANLMWWVWTACIYLGFIDSKAWTHQNFNGCFTNIHGALEGIFDPRVLYLV